VKRSDTACSTLGGQFKLEPMGVFMILFVGGIMVGAAAGFILVALLSANDDRGQT